MRILKLSPDPCSIAKDLELYAFPLCFLSFLRIFLLYMGHRRGNPGQQRLTEGKRTKQWGWGLT